MTAPLPPLPEWAKGSCWEKDVRDYAKLAVRQALERVIDACDDGLTEYRVRAIIKEYE